MCACEQSGLSLFTKVFGIKLVSNKEDFLSVVSANAGNSCVLIKYCILFSSILGMPMEWRGSEIQVQGRVLNIELGLFHSFLPNKYKTIFSHVACDTPVTIHIMK